jgi:hypothetical protein
MTMMREPSMIMLIFLSAALATPALAQTGSILGDDYQIMVPEKGSKRQVSKAEQPEPWLAPKYKSPGGTFQNLPSLPGSGPGGAETFQDRAIRCTHQAGV